MLHRKAGTRELVEVHGTIETRRAWPAARAYPLAESRARLADDPLGVPHCDCGEPLKPDVVLFGELLPEGALRARHELAAGADVLLCVGSSLEVHPIAQLPGVDARRRRRGGDRHAGPDAVGRAARRSSSTATSSPSSRPRWPRSRGSRAPSGRAAARARRAARALSRSGHSRAAQARRSPPASRG